MQETYTKGTPQRIQWKVFIYIEQQIKEAGKEGVEPDVLIGRIYFNTGKSPAFVRRHINYMIMLEQIEILDNGKIRMVV
jgi:hypothetical protein